MKYLLMRMVVMGDEEWGVPYATFDSAADATKMRVHMDRITPEYDEFDRGQWWTVMEMPHNPGAEELEAMLEEDQRWTNP